MPKPRTVRLLETAELLGVTKRRTRRTRALVGLARDPGVGEEVASLGAVTLADELEPLSANTSTLLR
jgi:hypothetical protein